MNKLILSVFMLLAVMKSNGQTRLQIRKMTDTQSVHQDTLGKIHYRINGKDSVISKSFAKKIIAKWKFDAVPKKII